MLPHTSLSTKRQIALKIALSTISNVREPGAEKLALNFTTSDHSSRAESVMQHNKLNILGAHDVRGKMPTSIHTRTTLRVT
jgi:hypothetical protein